MLVTFKYEYVYQGRTYSDSWSVRRAIENKENKRFGPEPMDTDPTACKEARVKFWAEHGVEYKESEVIVPEPDPQQLLIQAKDRRIRELETWFNQYRSSSKTFITSSLGFKANSNVTAFNNVDGLIGLAVVDSFAPEGKIAFMDFEDQPHMLDQAALITLKNEISAAASMAYQAKWQYRSKILAAETEEQVKAITFTFAPVDFMKNSL